MQDASLQAALVQNFLPDVTQIVHRYMEMSFCSPCVSGQSLGWLVIPIFCSHAFLMCSINGKRSGSVPSSFCRINHLCTLERQKTGSKTCLAERTSYSSKS